MRFCNGLRPIPLLVSGVQKAKRDGFTHSGTQAFVVCQFYGCLFFVLLYFAADACLPQTMKLFKWPASRSFLLRRPAGCAVLSFLRCGVYEIYWSRLVVCVTVVDGILVVSTFRAEYFLIDGLLN